MRPIFCDVGIRKRVVVTLVVALLGASSWAEGQRAATARIGVLFAHGGRTNLNDILERRLSDLGWVVAKNVTYFYRYGGGNERLPALARELVEERVDIIVSAGTPATLAARDATGTVPVSSLFPSVIPSEWVLLAASTARAVTSQESAGLRIN